MHDSTIIAQDLDRFRQAVKTGMPYKPLYVKIKIVWQCNLRCGMCNHWRDRVEPPLDLNFYKNLTDELAELGCQKVHLTGGEPTLRPNLEDLIAYMTERGIRVSMTTNATLIDDDRAYHLAQAGLRRVNVSIDSPDFRVHDRIRGLSGAWKKAVQGFRALRPWLKEGKMQINTVVGPWNYASLGTLPDLAVALGADRLNLIPVDQNTPDIPPLNLWQILHYNTWIAPQIIRRGIKRDGVLRSPTEAYVFGRTLQEIHQSRQGYYARGYYHHHPCFAPWTHALIDHVGQVSLCCMMPNKPVIGDLRQHSFREIWTGKEYTALRQTQHRPQFPHCHRCDMFLHQNQQIAALM